MSMWPYPRMGSSVQPRLDVSQRLLIVVLAILVASCFVGDRVLSTGLIAIATVFIAAALILLRRQHAKRLAAADDQETKARDHESKAHEMEEFAGRVAHDIRSPLSTASLATEMLDEQVQSDEAKSVIARLQRSLSRASAIIDGLLEFARAGANPEPGARANVRDVIYDIADGLGPELKRSATELEVEAVPSVHVRCSTGVLLSLIGNLVRNAVKYMGQADPRRVSIRTYDRGGSIRIEVSDTGPGIAEDVVPRLFDPYFRVSATSAQPGLGLGLPTVRKLAEGHGGKVGVSSVVGKGSTFWFELPYAGGAWESSDVRPRSAEMRS